MYGLSLAKGAYASYFNECGSTCMAQSYHIHEVESIPFETQSSPPLDASWAHLPGPPPGPAPGAPPRALPWALLGPSWGFPSWVSSCPLWVPGPWVLGPWAQGPQKLLQQLKNSIRQMIKTLSAAEKNHRRQQFSDKRMVLRAFLALGPLLPRLLPPPLAFPSALCCLLN